MRAAITLLLLASTLLAGCADALRERRLIEQQRQQHELSLQTERLNHEYRVRAEQARIQAEAQITIEATRAREQRAVAEHRANVLGRVLRLLIALGIPAALVAAFLVFRAYMNRLRIGAAVALGAQMSDQQRAEVIAGLLTASGIDARPLLLEHKRE